jgi:hypothetical protein
VTTSDRLLDKSNLAKQTKMKTQKARKRAQEPGWGCRDVFHIDVNFIGGI